MRQELEEVLTGDNTGRDDIGSGGHGLSGSVCVWMRRLKEMEGKRSDFLKDRVTRKDTDARNREVYYRVVEEQDHELSF